MSPEFYFADTLLTQPFDPKYGVVKTVFTECVIYELRTARLPKNWYWCPKP
jgi:hypothetical protein